MSTSTIDEILARALLVRHRHIPQDVVAPPAPAEGTDPAPRPPSPPAPTADEELRALCEALVSQTPAFHVAHFLTEQLPSPRSAVVLACVLQLAKAEDGARFWWQYAAGAEDHAAAYCLYLHHQSLGEHEAAQWWREQLGDLQPEPVQCEGIDPELGVRLPFDTSTVTLIRVLRYLAGTSRPSRSSAATGLIAYLPTAVARGYLREPDTELPLPGPEFASRVRHLLLAGTARTPPPARSRLPARPLEGHSPQPGPRDPAAPRTPGSTRPKDRPAPAPPTAATRCASALL